jgi:hypothetical protein
VIGEGLYECGGCGHTWRPDDGLEDLDAVACELCGMFDTFVREVRQGYQRGVAHAAIRADEQWAANQVDARMARHMGELQRRTAAAKEQARRQEHKRLTKMTRRMVRSYRAKLQRDGDQDG